MKRFFYLFINLIVTSNLFAQIETSSFVTHQNYIDSTRHYLSKIDTSNIITGTLIDYNYYTDNVFDFNGIDRVKTTNVFEYSDLYNILKYSSIDSVGIEDFTTLSKAAFYYYKQDKTHPISILNFDFNRIKQESLDNGVFQQTSDYLIDNNSKENDYSTHKIVASSSFRESIYGDRIKFVLPDFMFVSENKNEDILRVEIDFGNGQGYQEVFFNDPFIVDYNTPKSQYELSKVRTTFRDLTTNLEVEYYSQFTFYRKGSSTVPHPDNLSSKRAKGSVLTEDFNILFPEEVETKNICFSVNNCIEIVLGYQLEVHFLLSDKTRNEFPNTNGVKLRKPFIIVDGFDPGDKRDYYVTTHTFEPELDKAKDNRGLYELLDGKQSPWYNDKSDAGLVDKLRDQDYDLVFINFKKGAGDIIKNAEVLRSFLNHMNYFYRDSQTEKMVLVGPSMGGIITRIALTEMEQATPSEDHYVKLWLSFDSPQTGANIPLTLQYGTNFLTKINTPNIPFTEKDNGLKEAKAKATDGMEKLNSIAAQQLLLDHHLNSASIEISKLQDYLNELGYPKESKNIAISNGGRSKLYQEDGAHILDVFPKFTTWLYLIGEGQTNDDHCKVVFEGSRQGFNNDEVNWGCLKLAIENAPGGWDPSLYALNVSNKEDRRDGHVHNCSEIKFTRSCFIPTTSAFGISIDKDNIHKTWEDYEGRLDNNGKIKTPFDKVYGMSNNEQHVRISQATGIRLMDEILEPETININIPLARSNEVLDENISGSVAFKADQDISLAGNGNTLRLKNGANVVMEAGNSIIFSEGFTVEKNSEFCAEIKTFPSKRSIVKHKVINQIKKEEVSPYLNQITGYSEGNEVEASVISGMVDFIIYPNPTNAILNCEALGLPNQINVSVDVIDPMGTSVYQNQVKAENLSNLDVSNLDNGVYLIRFSSKEAEFETTSIKFLKL